jgi:hypothetical protein
VSGGDLGDILVRDKVQWKIYSLANLCLEVGLCLGLEVVLWLTHRKQAGLLILLLALWNAKRTGGSSTSDKELHRLVIASATKRMSSGFNTFV